MSKVTDLLTYWVIEKRKSLIIFPREYFTEEDQPLIDSGVFVKDEHEQEEVYCPFGCGDLEDVYKIKRNDGSIGRYVVCKHGEGERYLEPKEYELMRFVPEAYMRNWASKDILQGPEKPKKKRVARSTSFMKYQRDTVLDYVVNKCGRSAEDVSLGDCYFVWNHPSRKKDWDRRAKYTDDTRGYGNPRLLYKGIRYNLET